MYIEQNIHKLHPMIIICYLGEHKITRNMGRRKTMKKMNGMLLLIVLVVPWKMHGEDYQLPGNNNYYSEYYFNGRLDNALFIPESARYWYEAENYNSNFKLIPQLTHQNGTGYFHHEQVNLFSGRISEIPLSIGVSKASLVNVALHAWREVKKWRHKRKPLPDHYTAQQCAASCINRLNLVPPQDNFERNYFATFTPEIRKQLLQNYADYLCDGYIDFLQSFPEYEKHIEQIGSLPNMLDHYFFEENRFSSRKEAIIKTRVAWLYQKVKAKQLSQRQAQQEQGRQAKREQEKQQNEKQLQDYWNRQQAESTQKIETLQKSWVENSKEYDHIEQIYKEYTYKNPASESAYEVRIEKRYQALKESIDNQKYTMQKYTVTASVRDLLAKHEIDNIPFTTCCGNQFQQILHAEFITILDEAVHIEPRDKNEASLCLPEFTQEAAACNQAGKCTQALMIADYCWSVIDGVKKFGHALISSDYVCAMVNEAMHYSLQYHHHERVTQRTNRR